MGILNKLGLVKHAKPHFTFSNFTNYWQEPTILNGTIIEYYKRDGRFKMAVDTKRDFSVGNGFFLTGDESKEQGKRGIKA